MTQKNLITNTNKPMIRKVAQLAEDEKQLRALKERVDATKAELLAIMQKDDVLTLKTGQYTLSRATRVTPQVTNYEKLKESLDEANIPYETQETFADHMKETFKQCVKMGKELDGLEVKETSYVSVRLTK